MSIPITTTEAELGEFLKAKAATFNIPGLGLSYTIRADGTGYAAATKDSMLDIGDTLEEAVNKLKSAKDQRVDYLKAELAKLEAL
jgi:hypothetical protein